MDLEQGDVVLIEGDLVTVMSRAAFARETELTDGTRWPPDDQRWPAGFGSLDPTIVAKLRLQIELSSVDENWAVGQVLDPVLAARLREIVLPLAGIVVVEPPAEPIPDTIGALEGDLP